LDENSHTENANDYCPVTNNYRLMETWKLNFEWLRIQHFVKDTFKKDALPDLNAVLYLIGMQELALPKTKYNKEEKQDLMHIAICRLLIPDGYYEFEGLDQDGWPHYKVLKPVPVNGVKAQSEFLKEKVVLYFEAEGLIEKEQEL